MAETDEGSLTSSSAAPAADDASSAQQPDVCPICYEEFQTQPVTGAAGTEVNDSRAETENESGPSDSAENENENNNKDEGDVENGLPTKPPAEEGEQPNDERDDELVQAESSASTTAAAKERIRLFSCDHQFCRECTQQYIVNSVQSKDVPLQCPDQGCDASVDALETELVRTLLKQEAEQDDSDHLCRTYHRLQSLADHPSWLVCTACGTIVESDDAQEMDLTCPSCQHSFCRTHGDAHPGIRCNDYTQSRDAKRQQKSEKALNQWTKPCSHCGARIQKSKGCDYIVCSNCRRDFCFRCGTHEHLTGTKVRRCSKCQSVLEAHCFCHPACECLIMLFVIPLLLVLFLLYSVFATLVALLSCCCCGFYGLGSCLHRTPPSSLGTTTTPSSATTSNNKTYAPGRGVLAVVAVIFLPFLLFVEAGVEARGGNGFLNDILPPWFRDSVQEMPAHDPTAEDEDDEERAVGVGDNDGGVVVEVEMTASGAEDNV